MARTRSFLGRLARAILWLIVITIMMSVLAVASLRWINPPFTAFMAEAQIAAWANRDANYRSQHTWVDLARISPNLQIGRAHV